LFSVRINQTKHIWDIAERIGTCMLTTHMGDRLRSRPMHAIIERRAGCLWFITDQRGAEEIKAQPDVCLAFADIGSNTFLSLGVIAHHLGAARDRSVKLSAPPDRSQPAPHKSPRRGRHRFASITSPDYASAVEILRRL
jgi:Pyridoxamine 5'-phosphate oxidase like